MKSDWVDSVSEVLCCLVSSNHPQMAPCLLILIKAPLLNPPSSYTRLFPLHWRRESKPGGSPAMLILQAEKLTLHLRELKLCVYFWTSWSHWFRSHMLPAGLATFAGGQCSCSRDRYHRHVHHHCYPGVKYRPHCDKLQFDISGEPLPHGAGNGKGCSFGNTRKKCAILYY